MRKIYVNWKKVLSLVEMTRVFARDIA